ncbi:Rossmann-fold NAD(P)(+)-binding protein [Metarhizium album ARSEF 1941]|uniref:Rossmann-fold NAD(P)(+)-binding protein n=1 Tax=Metarhizium album (strain ARSEF 1941) TaxID=1081103 RepID=A0A0B2WRD0_METAS|nr:Rossmann-fold NAD(P)(+)-binding protein [Metarhizium album ARSEF 1941]KHN96169.1 Rossmann-fold NAD(P)(+)-binding protein [Metarhizium album ARSEF 1941]
MGDNLDERMARIHELELLRQDALHKTESITRDEEARLLQLRLLTMRDENASLRDKIGQKDFKISSLTRDSDQTKLDLDDSRQRIRAQEARLKKQDVDMASLKAEIEALNGTMQDSGKAMQEKFALARELNRIKPELEHLQSQVTSFQAMVAERNDLRRQLDSLEVELENEKRSRLRLQSKDDDTATAELKLRLEKVEQKLVAERREREKIKKEHERELASANAENERLEQRISSLKEKSKTLQSELKGVKEQLEDAQSELISDKTRHPPCGGEEKPRKAVASTDDLGKKRRAPAEMDFESITIQTPGNDIVARERPTRKRGAEKSTVGEKSAFSVTPFLNRNKSLTDDPGQESSNNVSADADPDPTSDEPADQGPPSESEGEQEPAPKPKVSFKSAVSFKSPGKPAKPRGRRPKATSVPLGDSTPAKTNRVMRSRGTPKVKSLPDISAEKTADHPTTTDQENVPIAASKKTSSVLQSKAPEGEAKKKKRKLLGAANTTLFDDDDGEAVVKPKPQPATGRRTRAVLGGGVRNAFTAGTSFSPLKRDRRGVNASFLA